MLKIWNRHPCWVEPPRIGHYREYPQGNVVINTKDNLGKGTLARKSLRCNFMDDSKEVYKSIGCLLGDMPLWSWLCKVEKYFKPYLSQKKRSVMNTAADKGACKKSYSNSTRMETMFICDLCSDDCYSCHFSFRLFSTATKEYSSSGADNLGN